MRFLADENFPLPSLVALRMAGYDVRSVAEEQPGLTDEGVAALCESDGRVLLTFDKDFGELVFRRGLRAGSAIVLFRLVPASPMEASDLLRSLIATGVLLDQVFCVATQKQIRVRPLGRRLRGQVSGLSGGKGGDIHRRVTLPATYATVRLSR